MLSVLRADTVEQAIDLITTTNDYGDARDLHVIGRAAREFERRDPAGIDRDHRRRRRAVAFFPSAAIETRSSATST